MGPRSTSAPRAGLPVDALDANERTLAAGTIHFNIYNFDQDPRTLAVADSNGQQLSSASQSRRPARHSRDADGQPPARHLRPLPHPAAARRARDEDDDRRQVARARARVGRDPRARAAGLAPWRGAPPGLRRV